jgi:nucleotide-binding universal stress UspA family protein
MPETILLLLRAPHEIDSLLGAGVRLAAHMGGARINVLAIRETVQLTPGGATTLFGRAEALVEAQGEEWQRISALRESFGTWATASGSHADAHWFEAEGDTTDVVAEWGRRADAIVVAKPSHEDVVGRHAFRIALFGTDRPILMVPPRAPPASLASFGRRIAIAWREEKQSLRAVLPALRWLVRAEQIHVLIGSHHGATRLGPPAVFLEHGLTASVHVLPMRPAPFGQTLLEAARSLSTDLLIMGAYAHSPLGELVLGGVTRYVRDHSDLPVLMRH